jgi:hypothetical protein
MNVNKYSKKMYQFLLILVVSIYFVLYSINETNQERVKQFVKRSDQKKRDTIFCMILTQPKEILSKVRFFFFCC